MSQSDPETARIDSRLMKDFSFNVRLLLRLHRLREEVVGSNVELKFFSRTCSTMVSVERLYAVTICGKRKPGMDEGEYHRYISQVHAGHLKELMVQNKIVDYTMQHNTSEMMKDLHKMFPNLPSVNIAPYDAMVQIVFRDVEDYIRVKDDPHYMKVVNPDHANFADASNTVMSAGWFERHIVDGRIV